MLTLDRVVIRQFLINFAVLTAVVMLLFCTIDLVADLDEFIEAGRYHAAGKLVDDAGEAHGIAPAMLLEAVDDQRAAIDLAERTGVELEAAQAALDAAEPGRVAALMGTVFKVVDFYGPTVLVIYVYLSGLIVVGAMGFTLTAMQRNRELIALAASGISLYRVALPLLLAGVALNALTLPLQEYAIPPLASKLVRSKPQAKYETINTFARYLQPDGAGALISAQTVDVANGAMEGVVIQERDERGFTVRRVTAQAAQWDDERGGWRLLAASGVRPPADDNPLGTVGGVEPVTFFATALSPEVLLARWAESYAGLLSVGELQAMARNEAVDDRLQRSIGKTIWSRFSLMVVNSLLLLVTLPWFLRLTTDGGLAQSVQAAAMSIGVWASGVVLMQVSLPSLNPVATAWLPVLILIPVSYAMLQRVRT